MGIDVVTLALAKKYAAETAAGAGAVAGVPCQIQSITEITGGHRVTFLWLDNEGVSHTSTMDVMDGDKGETGDDGLGIKSVDINAQNHLIVTYDDDTTQDAGELPGGTGEVVSVNGKKGVVVLDASDVGALADDTEIPTKTSDLTNDDGFITKVVNDLTNYYTKSTTYTKTEVNDLINALSTLTLDIVETLPVSDISTTTIYLTPVSGQQNVYMQYIYVNNEWAQLGTTQADLSNYYTKTQMDASLLLKQDALTFDPAPTAGSINPVTSGGVYTALQNVDVPVATTQTAGKVKPDGTTITVDANGVISGANTLDFDTDDFDVVDDEVSLDASQKIKTFTQAEWDALSSAEKIALAGQNVIISDDGETGDVVDVVEDGNMNPVTSNAVYDAMPLIASWTKYINQTGKTYFHKDINTEGADRVKWIRVTLSTHDSFGDASAVSFYLLRLNYTPYQSVSYRGVHKNLIQGSYNTDDGQYANNFDMTSAWEMDFGWDEQGIYIQMSSTTHPILLTCESLFGLGAKL